MNLQQIRTQVRLLIDQTTDDGGDFSNSQLNGFINEGQRFLATLVKWPRDFIEWQAEEGKSSYQLLSDTIMLLSAYFGDLSVNGDVRPLEIYTEEQLAAAVPSWMDEHVNSRGRPTAMMLQDRNTILVNPTPNAAESASGKKIHADYVYSPSSMSSDDQEPDLPIVYHDLLAEYGQYKCLMGKLNNQELGQGIFNAMLEKAKLLQPIVTKEKLQTSFAWGRGFDDPDDEGLTAVNP